MKKGGNFYDFFYNTRLVKPTILHFQVCIYFVEYANSLSPAANFHLLMNPFVSPPVLEED